jgi:hypothetical protein
MKLIDEWKMAYKFFSVQAMALGGISAATYAALFDSLKEFIGPQKAMMVVGGLFAFGILGRVIDQGSNMKFFEDLFSLGGDGGQDKGK